MSTLSIDIVDLVGLHYSKPRVAAPSVGASCEAGVPAGWFGRHLSILFMSGSLESGLLNPAGIERESMLYTPLAAA